MTCTAFEIIASKMFRDNHLGRHHVAYYGVLTANPFELSIFGALCRASARQKGKSVTPKTSRFNTVQYALRFQILNLKDFS